jgi:hypothetical protein
MFFIKSSYKVVSKQARRPATGRGKVDPHDAIM